MNKNNITNSILFALILSVIAFFIFSCGKKSNPISVIEPATTNILFTANNHLFIIDADGNNLKVLVSGNAGSFIDWQARLSRDGSKVVYALGQIYLLDLTTWQTISLTNDSLFHEAPIFSIDEKSVIFLTSQNWIESIYSKNLETGDLIQLTPGHNCRTPSFSPDNSKIIFWLNNGGDSVGVAVINKNGSDLTLLVSGTDPQFFPNGKKLLFNNFIPPYDEGLYTSNIDGTNRVFLSNIPFQTRASISPDGSKIVFANFVNNNSDIFIMNIDGSHIINLTNSSSAEFQPSFSPDGKKIVYISSDTSSNDKLTIMDDYGENKKILVNNLGRLRDPLFWHY